MRRTCLSGTALVTLHSKKNCERLSSPSNTPTLSVKIACILLLSNILLALEKWSTYRASGQSAWRLALLMIGTLGLHDRIVLESQGNYASFTGGLFKASLCARQDSDYSDESDDRYCLL